MKESPKGLLYWFNIIEFDIEKMVLHNHVLLPIIQLQLRKSHNAYQNLYHIVFILH